MPGPTPLGPDFMGWLLLLAIAVGVVLIIERCSKTSTGESDSMSALLNEIKLLREEIRELRKELKE